MDPQNNPIPNPNPETPVPGTPETPAAPAAPEAPAPAVPETPVAPAVPEPPVAPVAPEPPVAPVIEPSAPAAPEGIGAAPVNPVINPGGAPVAPVFEPSGVAATDPIMMPEPAKAPDPVEEELKAPMKAAAPVPGSIGSAVSGPAEGEAPVAPVENPFSNEGQTPNVSFTDPATQPEGDNPMAPGAKPKAKMNKNTLILLIVVAAIVVIALVAVLVIQLLNNNNAPAPAAPSETPNNATVIEDDNEDDADVAANNTLSCTRNMTDEEIVKYNDAVSGTINVSAEFNDENSLRNIALVESVVYSDEDSSENEPVDMEVHESTAEDLNATSGLNFYLEPNELGEFDFSRDAIEARYESLDFTCEVL